MLLTARAALGLTVGPTVGRFAATRTSSAAMSAGASKIPTAVEAPISLSSVLIEPKSDQPESWSGDLLVVSFWEPEEKDADLTLTAAQSAIDAAYDGALADLIEFHEF